MMRQRILFLFAWLLLSCAAMAQTRAAAEEQPNALQLTTNDGKQYLFYFLQQPAVTFGFDGLTVTQHVSVGDAERELLIFEREHVKEFRFVYDVTSINDVKSDERKVLFSMKQPGVVDVNGLQQGDRLQVVSLDGKSVISVKVSHDGTQTVDLRQQPRGVYVVSVNRSFTFKLMKP